MEPVRGEPAGVEARWPMVGAIVSAMVLTALLPDDVRLGPQWVLPLIEGVLLVAVIAADPRSVTRRSRELRAVSIVLVSILVLGALWSTVLLIDGLVHGSPQTNSASDLLEAGSIVWLSNTIAFTLLYWELDGGGAAARAHEPPRYPDLAFPQQLNPIIGPTGWSPRFVDYVYLSFTNSMAFSPTDVMPLVPWAKLAMAVQAVISLGILGLVIARAVNVFS
jgi:uncharacterized membrane protein